MRDMQRSADGPTWMARWSTAVRVLGPAKDTGDFGWMMRQMARGFHFEQELSSSPATGGPDDSARGRVHLQGTLSSPASDDTHHSRMRRRSSSRRGPMTPI